MTGFAKLIVGDWAMLRAASAADDDIEAAVAADASPMEKGMNAIMNVAKMGWAFDRMEMEDDVRVKVFMAVVA